MLLLLGLNHFSVEKTLDFDVFNKCVTNQPTDQPTDTAYYRDARTHLKSNEPDFDCQKGSEESDAEKLRNRLMNIPDYQTDPNGV